MSKGLMLLLILVSLLNFGCKEKPPENIDLLGGPCLAFRIIKRIGNYDDTVTYHYDVKGQMMYQVEIMPPASPDTSHFYSSSQGVYDSIIGNIYKHYFTRVEKGRTRVLSYNKGQVYRELIFSTTYSGFDTLWSGNQQSTPFLRSLILYEDGNITKIVYHQVGKEQEPPIKVEEFTYDNKHNPYWQHPFRAIGHTANFCVNNVVDYDGAPNEFNYNENGYPSVRRVGSREEEYFYECGFFAGIVK